MRRNAILIATGLRESKIGKVFHSVIDNKPSTLIYIKFKLAREHTEDMDKMLLMVEEHARKLVHKWIGDPSYEKTFGSNDLPRYLFYKYVSHQTPLRLSTSFGFSTTTLMFLTMDKAIWARISVGCESLPALDQLYQKLLGPILLYVDRLT
jgi:hypothetical protein